MLYYIKFTVGNQSRNSIFYDFDETYIYAVQLDNPGHFWTGNCPEVGEPDPCWCCGIVEWKWDVIQ
jgi:hypothetical protein